MNPGLQQWGLVLGNLGITKKGLRDDTVLMGLPPRMWINNVCAELKAWRPSGKVFNLSLTDYERLFRQHALQLGLDPSGLSPHVVRHSGPSNDRLLYRISLADARRRGQWGSEDSFGRYEKFGHLLHCQLVPTLQRAATLAPKDLQVQLVRALRRQNTTS